MADPPPHAETSALQIVVLALDDTQWDNPPRRLQAMRRLTLVSNAPVDEIALARRVASLAGAAATLARTQGDARGSVIANARYADAAGISTRIRPETRRPRRLWRQRHLRNAPA